MKRKIIFLFTILILALSFSATAEAKTITITVKTANKATAEKLDKQLKKGKKFTVKVKGNKKTSKTLLAKTNKQLQKVNKYSVIMNTKRGKTKKGYTYYTVSADNAKLYNYTILFLKSKYETNEFKKHWTTYEKQYDPYQEKEWDELNQIYLYTYYDEDRQEFIASETPHYITVEVAHDEKSTFRKEWKKNFCDLSTLQQAEVIAYGIDDPDGKYTTTKGYFTYDETHSYSNYDMQVNSKNYTKSQLMKRLYTRKATGVCGDRALYLGLVMSNVGIQNGFYESEKDNHACVIFKVTNSAGKSGWGIAENTLGFTRKGYCRGEGGSDWTIRNASAKMIKDAQTNHFEPEDIKELVINGLNGTDMENLMNMTY